MTLVAKLLGDAEARTSVCHQMLMGEGKTTVISPMLALLVGNLALVIQIVPPQLLAFALNVLRGCFSGGGPLRKATWTFHFDRRTAVTQALLDKLRTAEEERAVMLGTPAAFKAFMLKLLELLHLLDTGQYPKNLSKGYLNRIRGAMRSLRRSCTEDLR